MRRRTFDILMATAGLFLAVTFIAAGGLLTWAHSYIGTEVFPVGAASGARAKSHSHRKMTREG